MFVRMARRNSRLEAVGGDPDDRVENAWREVRDSVVDLGENWPVGSPRVVGAHLAHDLNGTAAKAATTLSLMVERERFARSHTISADLAAIVGEIRHGLAANQDRSQRILATVMPPLAVRPGVLAGPPGRFGPPRRSVIRFPIGGAVHVQGLRGRKTEQPSPQG